MSDFYVLIDEIAAVRFPLPEPPDAETTGVTNQIAYEASRDQAHRDRKEFASNLANAMDDMSQEPEMEPDPVIAAIRDAASDRDRADQAVRRLIAYAREYIPGRREYPLRALAQAAGRSESWTGKAYGDSERNAVGHIVASVRTTPANAMDTELRAMNAIAEMPAGQRATLLTADDVRTAFPGLDLPAATRIQQWASDRYPT